MERSGCCKAEMSRANVDTFIHLYYHLLASVPLCVCVCVGNKHNLQFSGNVYSFEQVSTLNIYSKLQNEITVSCKYNKTQKSHTYFYIYIEYVYPK